MFSVWLDRCSGIFNMGIFMRCYTGNLGNTCLEFFLGHVLSGRAMGLIEPPHQTSDAPHLGLGWIIAPSQSTDGIEMPCVWTQCHWPSRGPGAIIDIFPGTFPTTRRFHVIQEDRCVTECLWQRRTTSRDANSDPVTTCCCCNRCR